MKEKNNQIMSEPVPDTRSRDEIVLAKLKAMACNSYADGTDSYRAAVIVGSWICRAEHSVDHPPRGGF